MRDYRHLTKRDVSIIRRMHMHNQNDITQNEMAHAFGITLKLYNNIVNYRVNEK